MKAYLPLHQYDFERNALSVISENNEANSVTLKKT